MFLAECLDLWIDLIECLFCAAYFIQFPCMSVLEIGRIVRPIYGKSKSLVPRITEGGPSSFHDNLKGEFGDVHSFNFENPSSPIMVTI